MEHPGTEIAPTRRASRSPAKILLVDDNPSNLLALESILEELGEPLFRARSGREALGVLEKEEFALALVDVRMPDVNGFEFVGQVRGISRLRALPVIFLSAFEPGREQLEQAYDLGVADYVIKPLIASVLRSKVRLFVELFRSRRDLQRRVEERTHDLELAAATLRENEARLRLLVEQLPAVQWTTDDSLRFTMLAGKVLGEIGLQPAKLVGTGLAEVVPPGDVALAAHRKALEGTSGTYQGTYAGRQFESYVQPLRDAAGKVVGVVGVGFDRTERHAAEETAARLAAIVESSDDAIAAKTLDGIVTSWNRAAERLFGYQAEEIIGKSITLLIPEERLHEEAEIISRIKRGDRVNQYETVRRRKDGSVVHVALTISPVRDASGTIIGASKIARDITERRRAEEEASNRQAELGALKEYLVRQIEDLEALHTFSRRLSGNLDLQGVYRELLSAAVELQGCRMGFLELVDSTGRNLTIGEAVGHRPDVRGRLGPVPIAEGQGACGTAAARRERVVIEDVETDPLFAPYRDFARWAGFRSVWSVPLIGREGELLAVLSTHYPRRRGPTERETQVLDLYAAYAASAIEGARLYARAREKEAEVHRLNQDLERRVHERTASLEEMIRELDTFAYTVAHDLRGPVRAMQGCSLILLEEYSPKLDEQGQDLARRISQAGERMDALIRDLLAYSRLSREKVTEVPLELDALVEGVLRELSPEISSRGADVQIEGALPQVLGNEVMLRQALTNLVSNALKFVAPGVVPRVRIRAETSGSRIRLWVEDNGIGIAPEYQERLFKVFERLHADATYPGTGIGLAIVRRALERMGGGAGVVSQEGKGSRFWIEMSRVRSEP